MEVGEDDRIVRGQAELTDVETYPFDDPRRDMRRWPA